MLPGTTDRDPGGADGRLRRMIVRYRLVGRKRPGEHNEIGGASPKGAIIRSPNVAPCGGSRLRQGESGMGTLVVAERAAWRAARDAYVVRENALRRTSHPVERAAIDHYFRAACFAWAEVRLAAGLDADEHSI